MADFGLRWHEWRDVRVLTVRGEIDVTAAAEVSRRLARLQRKSAVFVDLWDVTMIDPVGLEALANAKQRAEVTGWDFALIAQPDGAVAEEIQRAGLEESLRLFATKYDARTAMRHP